MAKQSAQRSTDAGSHKPAATIRQGNLKLVLWRNESENGPWYVADVIRTFKDATGFHETNKVSAEDLLRVAFLAQQGYGQWLELKASDKAAAQQEYDDEPHPR